MVTTNQHVTQSCCEPFKALADETRLLIVRELLSKPLIVGELAERLSISHYNVAKHLKVLRECGVIVGWLENRVHLPEGMMAGCWNWGIA